MWKKLIGKLDLQISSKTRDNLLEISINLKNIHELFIDRFKII